MKYLFSILIIVFQFNFATEAFSQDLSQCIFENAVYSPSTNDKDDQHLKLRITKPDKESSARLFFLEITSYSHASQPISVSRFGYSCSNGVSVCRASAYYGQYHSDKELEEMKVAPNFEVTFLSKSFEKLSPSISESQAPYAIILPNTAAALYYRDQKDDPKYTKYYAENKEFPDFSNNDVWVLEACK